jgi:DNA-binding PadR family transcriptional regulator
MVMTTSSYAVLALLALRPWSAYDLARQAERSLRFAWPKSERHLYSEPKKLVTLGYATVHTESSGPRRTRSVYSITEAGREALAEWVTTTPSPPVFEAEAMLRLLFAEHGSVADLDAALERLKADTESLHAWSLRIVTGYLTGDDLPFPDRVHLSVLLATFELELFTLIERWAQFARTEISQWTTTRDLGMTPRTRELLEQLVNGHSVLPRRRPVH